MYEKYTKRIIDFCFAALSLIIFSPLLIIIAFLIKIKLGSPILFVQQRIGKDNYPFYMFKFRTMSNERDDNGKLLPDEDRLTGFGKMLRKTSIDELPALINILKGDMSLIGPRPLPVVYYPYFTDEELHRHDVRGGLTGLAQIKGRNTLTWEQRFQYDLQYVEKMSFGLDMYIFFTTIFKVLKQSDVLTRRADGTGDLDFQRNPVRQELKG